ncbi:LemA family protein [Clostridium frigidicarnis]|uniref:LemA protein n=1 Tax=Clostridium frigidicarnis TaxID=84698 RepID=A0A1I1AFZ8_9CLOT|nr:LemA family protein [Clostridium frigidicarnis]SFB36924.1 LemA protein [Clostridium frigidicarnis]
MKKIKQRTYTKRLISFICGFFIGWFFYLMIMAIVESGEPTDTQGLIATILSLITTITYELISEYNYLKRLELTTTSLYSNISLYKEREKNLLSKAEKFVLEFFKYESDIQKSVAVSRSVNSERFAGNEELKCLSNLKATVESYPDLKADKHVSKILEQLEQSENIILDSKLLYNEYTTYYNTAIVSFPAVLLTGLWKLKLLQFYIDNNIDEV